MPSTFPRVVRVRTAERRGPDRPSEDRIFTTANAVIVLDGASQPDPSDHDGGWLADTLGRELQHRLTHHGGDLAQALGNAINSVADRHRLAAGSGPSSTVSVVRWDQHAVEALVLGDCLVVALTRDATVHEVRDNRLHQVATCQRERLNSKAQPGFSNDDHERWRALVDAERTRRNHPDGYWIAEADPQAAAHALRARWPRDDLAAILVMTDGVSAGVHRYGIPPDWPAAFTTACDDPARLVDMVHDAETKDPDGSRWPRSKRHDDKALAVIRFHPTLQLAT